MQARTDAQDAPGIPHTHPNELTALMRLGVYVDHAALLMSTAFAVADVRDFLPARRRQTVRPSGDATRWYADLTNDVLTRLSEIRNALAHRWTSSPEADALATEAIELLAELTPVPRQLMALYRRDREAGLVELTRHLAVVERQYALAASLVARAGEGEGVRPSPDPASESFAAARKALLASAGGVLSLTEAANALGVTRQNLHKRIHVGSALGMLLDGRIVVPRLQLAPGDGKTVTIAGIERVVRPFIEAKAGAWSALQFLLDPDPNLRRPPIDALRAGDIAGAEHAARAYLGLDES
jgi:hypothetical protein